VIRRADYDLTRQAAVVRMFNDVRPDIVIHAAADVGGIGANQVHPGRFFYNNMAMGLNIIEESRVRHLRTYSSESHTSIQGS
jgi:GDP-L-fucose synthase